MKSPGITYRLVTLVLQAALVVGLFSGGWLIYQTLPYEGVKTAEESLGEATIQLVIRPAPEMAAAALDIPVELYPVDIVAVRHEYFTERLPGKRFDDFLNERMNGRTPITTRLDRNGQALVVVKPGNWWVHAMLAGEQDLEWRLPINVSRPKQTIELTPQNAYARTKSF